MFVKQETINNLFMGASENYDNDSEQDLTSIEKYNDMIFKRKSYYFDIDEFEMIVNYYLEKQDWVKALDAIEYSKKLHPFVPRLLVKEADLLGATGQHEEALELIARIELIEHRNPELFLIKGSLLSEINSTDKAIAAYIRAADLSCEAKDEVYISIAYEYQNLEKFEKAIDYLKHALQTNPANEDALYEIGFCFEQIDKPDQMITFLQAFLDEHPYCDHAWNSLGSAELRQGNHGNAIDAFDYALAINEDFVTAYFNKGSALIATDRFIEAIEIYEQSVSFDIAGSLAYHQIGYCNEQLGNFDKAIVMYNKATKIDNEFAESWISLARLYSDKNKHVEAIYAVKKALEKEEDNSEYWCLYAHIQGKAGLIEEAKLAYDKAIEIDLFNVDTWLSYSDLLFQNDYFDESIDVLNNGIKNNPSAAKLYYRLGAYFISVGYETDAEDVLYHALTMDFEKHDQLFEFMPQAKSNLFILDLINSFKEA